MGEERNEGKKSATKPTEQHWTHLRLVMMQLNWKKAKCNGLNVVFYLYAYASLLAPSVLFYFNNCSCEMAQSNTEAFTFCVGDRINNKKPGETMAKYFTALELLLMSFCIMASFVVVVYFHITYYYRRQDSFLLCWFNDPSNVRWARSIWVHCSQPKKRATNKMPFSFKCSVHKDGNS